MLPRVEYSFQVKIQVSPQLDMNVDVRMLVLPLQLEHTTER